jgi:hypothetical protein
VLSTDADWLRDLATHLRRGENALRAAAPGRAAAAARARMTGAESAPAAPRRPIEDHDPGTIA